MEILFEKEREGEIREILGFSDANIDIKKVWPYLRTASREIFKIIGEDNYTICETEFETASQDASKAEFLELVKYAIASFAIWKYAKLIDVQITDDGRLFRHEGNNVGAYEWQIDKNDDELERAYYASIDAIVNFVEDAEDFEPSDFMLEFSGLYVPNLAEFQKYVNINDSHFLYFKLAPSLRLCEQREIINRVGTKFLEFKEQKDSYIFGLIQNICVYYAMADGIQKYSVQLFPEGLMKAEKSNKKAGSGYDKESSTLYYRSQMESLLKLLEIEMKKLQPIYTSAPQINFTKGDGFATTS